MISFFYNIGIRLFGVLLTLLGLFNSDIKKWNKEREKHFNEFIINTNDPIIWVHCASLGEYEQIQPLLKKLKESQKPIFILLTFFSPSGYYARQKSPYPDAIIYLPLDIKSVMVKMVDKVKPTLFIGVKYEFWWNMLQQLKAHNTQIIYTNVVFQNDHYLFRSIFKKYKQFLQQISKVFVQDIKTLRLLESHGFKNAQLSGDMRIDNVLARRQTLQINTIISTNPKVFVWGSIYPNEMKMIDEVVRLTPQFKHYIVPHHVDFKTIDSIQKALTSPHSLIGDEKELNVVIVNKIGALFQLYQQARLAYVGGGMTGALHNILEPTISGVPTAIGPNHQKFPEANQLILSDIVSVVEKASDLIAFIQKYEVQIQYNQVQQSIKEYTQINLGATEAVYKYVQNLF